MFGWSTGAQDVDSLIAKGKYGKAIAAVRQQLEKNPDSVRWRQQLADLLALEGETREALEILSALAEEFVEEGLDAKGIAVLKKIQRIEPGNHQVEDRIADLIRRRRTGDLKARLPKPEPDELVLVRLADEHREKRPKLPKKLAGVSSSALFGHFSDEDLLAVIQGLQLKTFAPGQIVVTEGEPGESLFVLASGAVRVYVKDAIGTNEQVRVLAQGEFFGEISLLSRLPRTATIVTCCPCEILELDRPTLNRIARRHPEVPKIIHSIYKRRANSPEELQARGEPPIPF
ncbi:MAG: cyclic nucleotide-binding domain-containing protein [Acidobacteria bacterium]|nr:cyclic nucleotide-binding domain-containing protein [Acidobacteriota bacterium]